MFDALKGMAGLGNLMKDLPRVKERLERAKGELADMTVEAEVGGGAVVAIADGSMRIREVRIDPAMMGVLVDGDGEQDRSMAQDLVASAVNAALSRAQDMISTHLQEAAAELGLPLPPGGLPGLL
ncbi:MAG: YbaB/EbfC family nucleoid-associated protein [Phycisphaera sp.]|nr:YbaB/EbfC family nucleoid-associated protein [Phycisphaera sp.]